MMDNYLPHASRVIEALEYLSSFGVPPLGAASMIDVGSEQFLNYFGEEVLDSFVGRGGATFKIIEGAWGSGKTHLLQLLGDMAAAKGMVVVKTELSQALGLEDWHLVVKHLLSNMEFQCEGEQFKTLPGIIQALSRKGKLRVDLLRTNSLPHVGFAHAIHMLASKSYSGSAAHDLLVRFLLGEKITVAEFKINGISNVRHPLTQRNAELVLKTVLTALFQLGVPGTLMLFDETEKTFVSNRSQPPRKVLMSANLFRRLIDASASGGLVAAVAAFAVLPGFVENCSLAYPALGQRLQVRRSAAAAFSWRSPVLPLQAITTEPLPEQFLERLLDRFDVLMAHCGTRGNGHRLILSRAGQTVLSSNAGSGYRRDLMKRLSTLALKHIN